MRPRAAFQDAEMWALPLQDSTAANMEATRKEKAKQLPLQ
jgi:hypothetical protein